MFILIVGLLSIIGAVVCGCFSWYWSVIAIIAIQSLSLLAAALYLWMLTKATDVRR